MRMYLFILSLILLSCSSEKKPLLQNWANKSALSALWKYNDHSWLVPFDRNETLNQLRSKIERGDPLIVHALVPLCDNQYQGIVPTTPSLGDGFSLKSNLYWATSHGMKRYFMDHPEWHQSKNSFKSNDTILERVSFERKFDNGAVVVLICDAYRGDRMQECISDYIYFLAGKKQDSIFVDQKKIACGEDADLIVFNGHNGMHEVNLDPVFAVNKRQKDAVAIACSSYWNFVPWMQNSNCYPLVTTTQSMYPGATVLNNIIEEWAMLSDAEKIQSAASRGYHEMKNCGIEAAELMFSSGW